MKAKDWKKWAKKAIVESSNQIFGAERWIKRFPDRISLDSLDRMNSLSDGPQYVKIIIVQF